MARSGIKMHIEGQHRITLRLQRIGDYDPLPVIADKARIALAMMKDKAPVDTGRLRDELQMVMGDNVIVIFSPTHYSRFVELGTYFMRPREFFGISIAEVFPEYKAALISSFRESFGGKIPGAKPMRHFASGSDLVIRL